MASGSEPSKRATRSWGRLLLVTAVLASLFAFRLAFGLSSEFFFEDETQTYLIGLREYATGAWPFFGPDVVWTRSEIPGALEGLLVGVPIAAARIPEAPFVLLNLLSFSALAAFAWYTTRRLPWLPKWLVWAWFLTVPWTLHYSTHVINPSYVLPAAIVFFLGFFEALSGFTLGLISPAIAHFMMGAALTWVMQIHMSWPLMIPFAVMAWWSRRGAGIQKLALYAVAFAAGAAVPGSLLVPTLWSYGVTNGSGSVFRNFHVHVVNPWSAVTTLARFLSFASLEINRFIATDGPKRIEFFQRHAWLIVPAAIVWLAGIVQPLWMLAEAIRSPRRWPHAGSLAQWLTTRRLIFVSALVVYVSYWFVMEPPQAHAFYVLAPVALLFAAYSWTLVDSPAWRSAAAAVLATNVLFHAGLAAAWLPERSLYKRRDVVVAAIDAMQPEILGHRRSFAIEAGPFALGPSIPRDPSRDLVLEGSTDSPGPGGSVHWRATLRNRNPRAAYRDVLYFARYPTAQGGVEQHHEFIKDIVQPCEAREVEFNDGVVAGRLEGATLQVAAAEALLPTTFRACGPGTY